MLSAVAPLPSFPSHRVSARLVRHHQREDSPSPSEGSRWVRVAVARGAWGRGGEAWRGGRGRHGLDRGGSIALRTLQEREDRVRSKTSLEIRHINKKLVKIWPNCGSIWHHLRGDIAIARSSALYRVKYGTSQSTNNPRTCPALARGGILATLSSAMESAQWVRRRRQHRLQK